MSKAEKDINPYIKGPNQQTQKIEAIKSLNAYNKIFVEARQQGRPFNQQIIEALAEAYQAKGITLPDLPDELICPVTQSVFNVPVKVTTVFPNSNEEHEHCFDFSTLSQFHQKNKDEFKRQKIFCTHPINRLPIQPFHLIPAPEMQQKIDDFIINAKRQLSNVASPKLLQAANLLMGTEPKKEVEKPATKEKKISVKKAKKT